jgi:hypothetical protein
MSSTRQRKNLAGEGGEKVSGEPGGEAHGLKRSKNGNFGSWRRLIMEFGTYLRSGAAIDPPRAVAIIAAVLATTGCLHRPSVVLFFDCEKIRGEN